MLAAKMVFPKSDHSPWTQVGCATQVSSSRRMVGALVFSARAEIPHMTCHGFLGLASGSHVALSHTRVPKNVRFPSCSHEQMQPKKGTIKNNTPMSISVATSDMRGGKDLELVLVDRNSVRKRSMFRCFTWTLGSRVQTWRARWGSDRIGVEHFHPLIHRSVHMVPKLAINEVLALGITSWCFLTKDTPRRESHNISARSGPIFAIHSHIWLQLRMAAHASKWPSGDNDKRR